jgi:5-methylcytosine-specific restriction endonuclease McrA
MTIIRNNSGQFAEGCKFWQGKKRLNMMGNQFRKGKRPWNWKPKVRKHCILCGKEYFVKSYVRERSKFCSRSCRAKYLHTGSKNTNWKGGISSERDRMKTSDFYKKWRMKVFERDWFTCLLCGSKIKIEAHHIIPLRENSKLCVKAGNGFTLCEKCHELTYGLEMQLAKVFKEILNDFTPNIQKDEDKV